MRKRTSRAAATALLLALMLLHHPAAADRRVVRDDTESSSSQYDMASIAHRHEPTNRILHHEVRFENQPFDVWGRVALFFRFRNADGDVVRRELAIKKNPGGGLYGVFRNEQGAVTGYARAWMKDDATTLAVRFSLPALGRPARDRYRWYAWSHLGTGEFQDPCSGEDQGPPTCEDRAPAEGAVLHRL